uniref:Knottin scorpion toxin-like domain-containing protein n=1 Tax=Triticum urartu TaxID=4572 RepID=A0A8R7TT52_TRIUA
MFICGDMGDVKLIGLLCLFLLMPVLVAGSEAEMICERYSVTYFTLLCTYDRCVHACHKEHKESFHKAFCFRFPRICMCRWKC